MALFFKDTNKYDLINKYNLSNNLVQRRLQLLGPKIFKKCASGKAVDETELSKRVMIINRKFNLGFVVKDLVRGCELSEKPQDDVDVKYATENILQKLKYMDDMELENLELMETILPKDIVQSVIGPNLGSRYIKDNKLYNLDGELLMYLTKNISKEILKQFLKNIEKFLKSNVFAFFRKWARDKQAIREIRWYPGNDLATIDRTGLDITFPNYTVEDFLKTVVPDLRWSAYKKIKTFDELYTVIFWYMEQYLSFLYYKSEGMSDSEAKEHARINLETKESEDRDLKDQNLEVEIDTVDPFLED